MTTDYGITNDEDLIDLVYALSLYEDNNDELPRDKLEGQLRGAKIKLSTKVDETNWYDDNGLSAALLGTTLILAKCAVENFSVSSWDMGGATIDVSGAGDIDQAQFNEWATMVSDGLTSSDSYTTLTPTFSKTFIGG